MCYDLKVSIVSFVTVSLSGLAAIKIKQPTLGLLMICYGLIQLAEAIIWIGIDKNNKNINKIGTKLAKYSLPLHNIAIGIGILIAFWAYKNNLKYWIPLFLGIIFYIIVLIIYHKNRHSEKQFTSNCDLPKDSDRCTNISARLQWPFPYGWYFYSFLISLVIMIVYIKPLFPNGAIIGLFYGLLWFITLYLGKSQVQGSFWCWSVAIFSPILVIMIYFISKKNDN
jgi:hypothetical protein